MRIDRNFSCPTFGPTLLAAAAGDAILFDKMAAQRLMTSSDPATTVAEAIEAVEPSTVHNEGF